MECDFTIEQAAAEVLETIVAVVCSGKGSLEKQDSTVQGGFSLPQTTSNSLDSWPLSICDSTDRRANELVNKSAYADTSQVNAMVEFCISNTNTEACSNDESESDVVKDDMDDAYTQTLSDCGKEAYKECHRLIKSLLSSFDTETNNGRCVELDTEHFLQEQISNETKCQTSTSRIENTSCSSKESTLVSDRSRFCESTKGWVVQKKAADSQNLWDEIFSNNLDISGELDSNVECMVEEILLNNVQNLASDTHPVEKRKSKLKKHPALQDSNLAQNDINPNIPVTPECSEDFSELKLHSKPEVDCISINNTIPPGWLNTLTKRKQRPHSTSHRAGSREEDFVYCGPAICTDESEEKGGDDPAVCESCLKLCTPEHAGDIPAFLLYSGVVLAPGTCDKQGSWLVIIQVDDILWQKCNFGTIALARFLLYLTSTYSEITLIIDVRNSETALFTKLMETLNLFQNNSRVSVCRVLILSSDASSNAEASLKSLFNCQCSTYQSINGLSDFVESSNLPTEYGGSALFSHAEWAHNRLIVDSFVSFCENVRHNFAREILAMTSQPLPNTVKETRELLAQHHKDMANLLDDRQVTNMRDRGQRILQQLSDESGKNAITSAELVQSSYEAANEAVTRFVQLGDDQLLTLERHLLVKQFEQSCEYIFHWYTSNTKILTEKFTEIADSLEELREQRMDFDRFYMNAMTEYARCDCMLSEVEQLNRLGYLREVELTQRAAVSEEQVKELVLKMERKKEEIEVATQMYKFIDQAYSWALDGMKFVASLNLEECVTLEACQEAIERFDKYMEKHPPVLEKEFSEIFDLARRYGNVKCLSQCEFAQHKCKETSELFTKRRDLLGKVKSQIKASSKKRITSFRLKSRDKTDKAPSHQSKNLDTCSESLIQNTECGDCKKNSPMSDNISPDNMSLYSTESSGFDELSQHTARTSTSSNYTELSDISSSSKSNQKPARKILKKSCSMPSQHLSRTLNNVHSLSGMTLAIGSPVPVPEEPEETGKSKLSLIIDELIATEREYVRSLNYVIENYLPEMKRLDIPQAIRCKGNVIFGNIVKIAEFHAGYFLRDLEKCKGSPLLVARTFQAHKENFGLYALYSKNKPQSDQLLREHGNEFFRKKQMQLGDKMDLASYLLKPVQRMGKYALLLHAMSKRASVSDERSLKDAEELVKFQLRHGNDLLTMDSIQDCDVNLKEQGNLLRQEQFIMFSGRRKIVRRVFLFEDLILFSKPIHVHGGHDIYQYKCSYKTTEIGMTENIGESGFKFEIWFRRRRAQTTQDRFVLQNTTRATKRAWVEEIRGLLWKQALRNKDHRKLEMSSMGVGSKPHLDLALSSENRIIDRAVAGSQVCASHVLADRLSYSRCRSSIAVSTFDHASQQNKRPHSTISTSSSTSSVGSGNNPSGQLLSSLTLASWPSKTDAVSSVGLVPPMAYCDFHAIAENLNEDGETSSESSSSVCTSHDAASDVSNKTPVARQYVTTV